MKFENEKAERQYKEIGHYLRIEPDGDNPITCEDIYAAVKRYNGLEYPITLVPIYNFDTV